MARKKKFAEKHIDESNGQPTADGVTDPHDNTSIQGDTQPTVPVHPVPVSSEPSARPSNEESGAQGALNEKTPQQGGRVPDPFAFEQITLGAESNSPKMRLLRSQRFGQLLIAFDEKPAEQYRIRLRDAGWKWRNEEGVWTIQLDKTARWRTQADAESLFREIGNAIRVDQGLPPIQEQGR